MARPENSHGGTAWVVLAIGALLLLLNCGRWVFDPVVPPGESAVGKGLPAYYVDPILEPDRVIKGLRSENAAGLEELTLAVHRRIAHGPSRSLGFGENWMMALAGLLRPDLSQTQRPLPIARGQIGLCHDAVIVLNALLRRAGWEVRMVDLVGHVVSEVHGPGGWVVADPDLGILYAQGVEELSTQAGATLVKQRVLAAGYGPKIASECERAFVTQENNRIIPGDALRPRLALLERITAPLCWLIPLCMLWFAVRRLRGKSCLLGEQQGA